MKSFVKELKDLKLCIFSRNQFFYKSPNDMEFKKDCQFRNIKPTLGSCDFFLSCFLEIYVIGPLRFPN